MIPIAIANRNQILRTMCHIFCRFAVRIEKPALGTCVGADGRVSNLRIWWDSISST
jgi:hypothetical protein